MNKHLLSLAFFSYSFILISIGLCSTDSDSDSCSERSECKSSTSKNSSFPGSSFSSPHLQQSSKSKTPSSSLSQTIDIIALAKVFNGLTGLSYEGFVDSSEDVKASLVKNRLNLTKNSIDQLKVLSHICKPIEKFLSFYYHFKEEEIRIKNSVYTEEKFSCPTVNFFN
jgi:hypothetical protein